MKKFRWKETCPRSLTKVVFLYYCLSLPLSKADPDENCLSQRLFSRPQVSARVKLTNALYWLLLWQQLNMSLVASTVYLLPLCTKGCSLSG